MTRYGIKRVWLELTEGEPITIEIILKFALMIAYAEREECAQLVEEMTGGEREKATLHAAAAAIRARVV
jgi:hypothetical protein